MESMYRCSLMQNLFEFIFLVHWKYASTCRTGSGNFLEKGLNILESMYSCSLKQHILSSFSLCMMRISRTFLVPFSLFELRTQTKQQQNTF